MTCRIHLPSVEDFRKDNETLESMIEAKRRDLERRQQIAEERRIFLALKESEETTNRMMERLKKAKRGCPMAHMAVHLTPK